MGGYAVALHGYPRYTKDLDIWIESSPANAQARGMALNQFGMASLGLTETDFLDPDQVIQIGYPPNRIGLLSTVSGLEFTTCYAQRVSITLDGVEVNFIDLKNLRKNKKASGRLQDLADLENLDG
mgnify:CR=1 FL=1